MYLLVAGAGCVASVYGEHPERRTEQAEPRTMVRADQTLVRVIPLARGCSVRFEAKQVAKADVQQAPGCGYAVYDGQLWISPTAVPNVILTRGVFFDGEKEVELDVSGLANPWVEADELEARNCELKIDTTEENEELITLKVAFMKWGAEDYIVEWVVMDGRALRLSIAGVGDTLPEWMENPGTPQGQYEVGNALWANGSRDKARVWWKKAADRGHAKATEALKRPVEVT